MKWYKDRAVSEKGKQCDKAILDKNLKYLLYLSTECEKLGEIKATHIMCRAQYYYFAFNCYDSYRAFSKKTDEKHLERSLFLCRKSLMLADKYKESTEYKGDEKAHKWFRGYYFQLLVNYANLLDSSGRIISAIEEYFKVVTVARFDMAEGNLAMSLMNYAKLIFDQNQRSFLLGEAKYLFEDVLSHENLTMTSEAEASFSKSLDNLIKIHVSRSKIKGTQRKMSTEEREYRKWVGENVLALNPLNDVVHDINAAYDPIHFGKFQTPVDYEESTRFQLIGLINEIKQEYVTARFQLYRGLTDYGVEFSDLDVYLVDNWDGAIYAYSVEQLKDAFKAIYSIFDRISFFINAYFKLKINFRSVSFKHIWESQKLLTASKDNYALRGLNWIEKDLYRNDKKTKSENYKDFLDPKMKEINTVRNFIEHRYLRVVQDSQKTKCSDFIYEIRISDFRSMGLYLLKKCREAIILLLVTVYHEENKNTEDGVTLFSRTYDDSMKLQ
ncbi:LA2681 family HEPN domain-containing protein [Secundilactobacillus yichangensis]|uniref:LA2681 family HEPN domain-containing protein n=1 Tax=Secundilactobacillus yichangensis TaxID=2799580 RepID=UPI0019438DE1|nr:LA2681 family HEPN domain-containing protein [Secundilactobacillus yichangensis]